MVLFSLLLSLASQPTCNESIKKEIYVDSRDGQKYKTILIQGQKWFAQNLNYNNGSNENVCAFGNEDSCKIYGRHYTWESANQKDVCPKGYHLPNSQEFNTLMENTGGKISGINLKAISGFPKYYDIDVNGTDDFGWCGLPNITVDHSGNILNGCEIRITHIVPGRIFNDTIKGCKGNEYYWTKDEKDSQGIRYLIGHGVFNLTGAIDPKNSWYSIRCINDTDFYGQYYRSIKRDTVKEIVKKIDTLIKKDTITIKKIDTLFKTKFDTIRTQQIVIKNDTVNILDTIIKNLYDTITTYEIVNGFKESDKFYYEKLHIDFGKPTKTYSGISYGSFDDSGFVSSSPTIQIHTNIKSNVRIFVYDNIGTFVDKEEFRISENKYYYFSFNGYNSIKQKVVNGIYLIRVITEQNNKFSNTVYKVGIKND